MSATFLRALLKIFFNLAILLGTTPYFIEEENKV